MSKLLAIDKNQFLSTTSSSGSSNEHYKIIRASQQVQRHRLEAKVWKYNTSLYLFSDLDISEFENRVEEIRDELLEGHLALSKEDVNILKQLVRCLSVFQLLAVARLMSPLLENERLSQDAAYIISVLLAHPADEVRYAALEAISFALGEVPIAEEILAEAKNLLKNEESTFVREFLESL
ncbi:MAG: hypothetical protein KME21_21960 [Desmonostoc vinosum HA7617-LM4]|jgi:hypothetical protein|nr:hypothetical protein [Desmonostoc vinosum HA7617-LM4]